MRTAFIFHGTGADPDMHWFPWLKEELEKEGFNVVIPDFPTPENQSRENWLDVFEEYDKLLDEEAVLIGHSTGAVFTLNVLQRYDQEVAGCFLVAGFTGPLGSERFDPLNRSFAERDFDWEDLREKAEFFLYHSEDDPYVPVEKAESLTDNLEGGLRRYSDRKHINQDSGFTEFQDLLTDILELTNQTS